ncbi:MAG TPA: ABC transporter ATP-binding protein [Clostridia bacterium]
MLKLIKYLKPFALSVILIFLLLFAQAQTDLALPDYMANIVNIGLQRGGIADAVPKEIRTSELDKLLMLMNESDRAMADSRFERVDTIARPLPLSADQRTQLGLVLTRAMTLYEGIASGQGSGMGQLPAGSDPFAVLAALPAASRQAILDKAGESLAAIPEAMQQQAAATFITAEYKAVGLDTVSIQTRYILGMGGMMLLIALLGAVCTVAVGFLAARVAAGLARNLRNQVFRKVESFSNTEFDAFSTASLITRSTNDIQQIQMTLVILLRILFYAPILAIGGILKVVRSDISMTWIIAAAIAALMTMILVLFIVAIPRFKMIQKLIDRLNLVTREILTGLPVIRAFNAERHQEAKFDKANQDLTRVNLFVSRIMVVMMPFMMLIMNGVTLLIVWVGARQIDLGAMQIGNLFAFIQYSMQIIMSFLMVSFVFILLPRASVSAVRIDEVLQVEPTIRDPSSPEQFPSESKGEIEFRRVGFRYPGAEENVLSDISFTAKPGETTAFIGSTGSGKSTLVNLIPRFYDVTEGAILVDGVDIRKVTQKNLRERIGYVPQKGVLFTGDIASNIRYGRPGATDEEVRQAAQTAQALEFIDSSGEGFGKEIAQSGANVSGGQKQRLSIARALALKPSIFIFDDSFSALDFKTDAMLRKALKTDTAHATVLIVAQRIGTIMNADRIIVLDEGRISGVGTHRELMRDCPVYQEIALSQLSKEELAV